MVSPQHRTTAKRVSCQFTSSIIVLLAIVGIGAFFQQSIISASTSPVAAHEFGPPCSMLNSNDTHPMSRFYKYPMKAPVTVPLSACLTGKKPASNTSFLTLHEVQMTVTSYEKEEFALERKRSFIKIGRLLYERAAAHNKMLLTLQIGGMDGISGDPMYKMMVDPSQRTLGYWFPIVVEPVPANFDALTKTYANIFATQKLNCQILSQWAVSYSGNSECTFCHFNVSENAHPDCNKRQDWGRQQLGTLDCEYSRKYFKTDFDKCIVQDKIPCGTVAELFEEKKLPTEAPVAILQIDVEGYEHVILPSLLSTLPNSALPPVIHFEHKLMRLKDSLNGTSTHATDINRLLRLHGYLLFDEGEDMLALRVSSRE